MKRIRMIILALVMLLMAGCQGEKQSTYLALISKADGSGRLVYYDENLKKVATASCGAVSEVLESGNVLYLSADGKNWQGYRIDSTARAGKLENVIPELCYVHANGNSWLTRKDGMIIQWNKGKEIRSHYADALVNGCDDQHFYIVARESTPELIVFDLDEKAVEGGEWLRQDDYIGFMEAGGQYCLVSQGGISVLKDGRIDTTYVYPVKFDEIENAFAGRIFVYEGEELVVYRVGFSGHSMTLELEKEERYYREINVDELLADELEEGDSLLYFAEAQN